MELNLNFQNTQPQLQAWSSQKYTFSHPNNNCIIQSPLQSFFKFQKLGSDNILHYAGNKTPASLVLTTG